MILIRFIFVLKSPISIDELMITLEVKNMGLLSLIGAAVVIVVIIMILFWIF